MQNNINLAGLRRGERAILSTSDTGNLPAKFYELGFIPGAQIEIKHIAPLHGPICVRILDNNSLIALRRSEALRIIAERI